MQVLHFYKTSFPDSMGGVEQVINQLARGATRLGVMSDVLSLTRDHAPKTITINGYNAHRARQTFQIASTGFSISAFLRFAKLAKQADVIHYHFPWPFMDMVHFATQIKKPTIVSYHSDIVRQKYLLNFYRPLQSKFLESVDCIVASSPNYVATSHVLQQQLPKVSVIPIGLDKATYPLPRPARLKYWREKIGPKFFLFVGVLRYYKGLHILLAAAHERDYPIVVIGNGPLEQALKAQADQLGLHNLRFLGHVLDEDKVALLTLCYCVLLPSHLRSEAFGIALLEGAMYGKPMISCEIGTGTTFINIAEETGLVVPPNDPIALRNAMQQIWENPELAAHMGRRAEQRYWKFFTAEQMISKYVQLYRELSRK